MTTNDDSKAIGRLEAQFESMQRQLDELARAQREALEESREGRRRIYEAQDESRKEMIQARADVTAIKKQMSEDKPILDGISRWRERIVGMQILISGVAAAIGGATVIFWKWIALKIGLS